MQFRIFHEIVCFWASPYLSWTSFEYWNPWKLEMWICPSSCSHFIYRNSWKSQNSNIMKPSCWTNLSCWKNHLLQSLNVYRIIQRKKRKNSTFLPYGLYAMVLQYLKIIGGKAEPKFSSTVINFLRKFASSFLWHQTYRKTIKSLTHEPSLPISVNGEVRCVMKLIERKGILDATVKNFVDWQLHQWLEYLDDKMIIIAQHQNWPKNLT